MYFDEFNSSKRTNIQTFANLSKLSQHFNVAYFREDNVTNLLKRLSKLDESNRVFVEISYEDEFIDKILQN